MSGTDPIRVLIVDNEADAREWLAEWLRRTHKFEVVTANDGAEAIDRVQKTIGNYDAILIDVRLGTGPDGIETMRAIRVEHPSIEVIIITGFGSVDDGVRAMKEGAYGYVFKPLNRDEIVVYIRSAAERRRLKSELDVTAREREWLQSLLVVSEAINATLNLDEVLELILDHLGRVIAYDTTSVQLLVADSLRIVACRGFDQPE